MPINQFICMSSQINEFIGTPSDSPLLHVWQHNLNLESKYIACEIFMHMIESGSSIGINNPHGGSRANLWVRTVRNQHQSYRLKNLGQIFENWLLKMHLKSILVFKTSRYRS